MYHFVFVVCDADVDSQKTHAETHEPIKKITHPNPALPDAWRALGKFGLGQKFGRFDSEIAETSLPAVFLTIWKL
jgi:hypothetical protein